MRSEKLQETILPEKANKVNAEQAVQKLETDLPAESYMLSRAARNLEQKSMEFHRQQDNN